LNDAEEEQEHGNPDLEDQTKLAFLMSRSLRRGGLWDFVGDTHPDVDICSPELDCDARCGKLEWQNSEPSECIIPSNSKATVDRC
jgi:hypothetical protein